MDLKADVPIKHSSSRIIAVLFKRQFLMKIRSIPSLIEIGIGIIIGIFVYLLYSVLTAEYEGNQSPDITYWNTYNVTGFFANQSIPKLFFVPDHPNVRTVLGAAFTTLIMNAGIYNTQISYVQEVSDAEDIIFRDGSNAAIIKWNSYNELSLRNLSVDMYFQGPGWYSAGFLFFIRKSIASMDPLASQIAEMNTSYQAFPETPMTVYERLTIVFGIVCMLPIFFTVLPDLQVVLEDRDRKVLFLAKTMGLRESEYWFVMFIVPFIVSLPPYIIIAVLMTCVFGAISGTPFMMIMVLFILYIISFIWCQYFLISVMNSKASGRYAFVILLVLALALSQVHGVYTLEEGTPTGLKQFFSIFPFSALYLTLVSILLKGQIVQRPLLWSDIASSNAAYPLWWGYMWLAIDSVLYFALFCAFNAMYPRQFGKPPVAAKSLFTRKFWKKKRPSTGRVGSASEAFLRAENVTKKYTNNGQNALDSVSFTVKLNEVVVIIGANGAGKSTLVNIIANGVIPTSGQLKYNTECPIQMGIVLQENVLIPQLSVKEHIELFSKIRGVNDDTLSEYVDYFGDQLQLTHMMDNKAGDLSGGQKRKLSVALSLIGNPKFIIMDEPTVGVDVQARQLIWKMIASIEATCIITTHALEEAETVSSRLFILASGKIPFSGTSTELRREFKCGYILRLEGGDRNEILELAMRYVPDSKTSDDRGDSILIPIDKAVPRFLKDLEANKDNLGVRAYSFSIENIDDTLAKLNSGELTDSF